MDAGLGGWVAHHADSLARAFTGASVGLGALATYGQAAQVANAAIALDTLQALQIHPDLTTQVTFDDVFAILDGVHNLRELLLGQILGANAGIDVGLGQDVARIARANAIDVAQGDVDAFVRRNFYSNDAGHRGKGLVDGWITWINGLMD